MGWIEYIPKLLPFLVESITLVEVLCGPGSGDQKKQAVLDAVEFFATNLAPDHAASILKWAGVAIDLIVWVYNVKGVFTHGSQGPAAA